MAATKGYAKRRKARECALQALYQLDSSEVAVDDALADMRESFGANDSEVIGYAEGVVRGVVGYASEIDELIQRFSPKWRIERMARVDRNILRVATFELLYRRDVPLRVVINEAVEVGKRFGTENSKSFINGVLDQVARSARSGEGS